MTDEDKPFSAKADEHDGELLLYDFFKHLTSLVLLTLGGLLIVMKDFDPEDVNHISVLADIVVISASGVLAFAGTSEIVRARYSGTPTKQSIHFLRVASPALLALGVGIFLAMFMDNLT